MDRSEPKELSGVLDQRVNTRETLAQNAGLRTVHGRRIRILGEGKPNTLVVSAAIMAEVDESLLFWFYVSA